MANFIGSAGDDIFTGAPQTSPMNAAPAQAEAAVALSAKAVPDVYVETAGDTDASAGA